MRIQCARDEQVKRALERFADPTETSSSTVHVGWDVGNSGAVAQSHHGRAFGRGAEMGQQVAMVNVGFLADASGVRMPDLLESPGGGVQPAPGVATGGKPGPPITNVFQASRRQKPPLQLVAVRGAPSLVDDPVRAFDHSRRRFPQPGVIAREAVMLAPSSRESSRDAGCSRPPHTRPRRRERPSWEANDPGSRTVPWYCSQASRQSCASLW